MIGACLKKKDKKKNSLPSNIIKTDNTSEIVSLKGNYVGERGFLLALADSL